MDKKNQTGKKKVVVTTKPKAKVVSPSSPVLKKKAKPSSGATKKTRKTNKNNTVEPVLSFGKENYLWMAIGFGLVILGMLLMLGGHMENPNVWDENVIYGFRRTVLAPLVIVAGLVVEIFAIFKGYKIQE